MEHFNCCGMGAVFAYVPQNGKEEHIPRDWDALDVRQRVVSRGMSYLTSAEGWCILYLDEKIYGGKHEDSRFTLQGSESWLVARKR